MEMGNLTAAGLIIGQFVTGKGFSWNVFTIGILLSIFCYIMSYIVSS